MEEYSEDLDKNKKNNIGIKLFGILLFITGLLIVILNLIGFYILKNLIFLITGVILIHISPLFITKFIIYLKKFDYGGIGNTIIKFLMYEVIFSIISFNLIFFLK